MEGPLDNCSSCSSLQLQCCQDTTCAICLADFEDDDEVTRLPCGHLFHLDEIQQWLSRKVSHSALLDYVHLTLLLTQPLTQPLLITYISLSSSWLRTLMHDIFETSHSACRVLCRVVRDI